jgi:hypothetical protein
MKVVRRLVVVIAAYVVATTAAAVAMIAASLLRAGVAGNDMPDLFPSALWLTAGAVVVVTTAAALPSLVAIALAEWLGWRLLRIYVIGGIAIALLTYNGSLAERLLGEIGWDFPSEMQDIIIGGGIVGGVIYWATAGRSAGRAKSLSPVDAPAGDTA